MKSLGPTLGYAIEHESTGTCLERTLTRPVTLRAIEHLDGTAYVRPDPRSHGIVQFEGDFATFRVPPYISVVPVYTRSQGRLYGTYFCPLPRGATKLVAPLFEEVDTWISTPDHVIDCEQPYIGMTLTYGLVHRPVGPGPARYLFDRVIQRPNGGTIKQVYEWGQRQLRKKTDINSGRLAVPGVVAADLFKRWGPDLALEPGVYIEGADWNPRVQFNPLGHESIYPPWNIYADYME